MSSTALFSYQDDSHDNQDPAALQDQLFRYAQDLQELMWQYAGLESRHQKMLLSLERGESHADPLLDTMLQFTGLYLVTDLRGEILALSPDLDRLASRPGRVLKGQPVGQLVPPAGQPALAALLRQISQDAAAQAVRLCRLVLPGEPDRLVEALVLQPDQPGPPELYWLLADAQDSPDCAALIQRGFAFFEAAENGLLITNAAGNIEAVNPTFSRITDYTATEARGCNPRLLGSGLHDAVFFEGFWQGLAGSGSWTGELFNRRKSGQVYLATLSVKAIRNFADDTVAYIGALVDRSTREAELRQPVRSAFHDPLTGLATRQLLDSRMRRAMVDAGQRHAKLFVLFLSLDRFEVMQGELGQVVADRVLQEVSVRMVSTVRRTDTVARVGGDGFVVLLTSVDNREDAEKVADALVFGVSVPFQVGNHQLQINPSIGGACYPADGDAIATLLTHAQLAMQSARKAGIPMCFFEPGPDPEVHPVGWH